MTDAKPKKTAAEKRAEAEEAKSGWPKKFTWRDMEFAIPRPDEWTGKTLRAMEEGKAFVVLPALFGEIRWRELEDMTGGELGDLVQQIAVAAGFVDSGE